MAGPFIHASHVLAEAKQTSQRAGQFLFNQLPAEAANVVAGTIFDPFHKNFNEHELQNWMDSHLIFDGYDVIAVFDNNTILWEA